MTALDLLLQMHELGVILTPSPDSTVCCRAPTGVLTPDLLDAMRQHKQELYALVEDCEERAAIAQYCSGIPRPEAEALAWPQVSLTLRKKLRYAHIQEACFA